MLFIIPLFVASLASADIHIGFQTPDAWSTKAISGSMVPGSDVTLATHGHAVDIQAIGVNPDSGLYCGGALGDHGCGIVIMRDEEKIATIPLANSSYLPVTVVRHYDQPAMGAHKYWLRAFANGISQFSEVYVYGLQLVVHEL